MMSTQRLNHSRSMLWVDAHRVSVSPDLHLAEVGYPLDDIDDAVKCTIVNIESFTVPAGKTFEIELADGTTVNLGR